MSQEESRVIKKPRLGTSQNSLSSPPSVSATHRFLQTPELFCFLLDHLDFDKLDMVTLSTVSKRMRINVLPRLMRSINLPLDRAFDLQEVLRAYPGLVDHIRDLTVTSGREAGTFASPEIVNSLSTLRRLDGGADPVSAFLRAGAPLNLVQIHSKDSVHYVPRSPLSSITCLNILDVVDEDFDSSHTVLMLERLLRENRFPNLVELAVRYKGGRREKFYDTSAESAQALAAILEALSNQRVTVLRALWVGCDTAQALPSDEVLAKVVKEFPPALRYVSWYLPFSNTTQHFRVLPPSKLFYPPSSSCALVILSPQQRRRLQRLPSSFRPMVAQTTGVWKGLDGEPDDQLIFDHTGDSPRLKYV
ncbi:unnamed protein product [Tilletia controversa]|nr:unnamed protein product [Tilletia controversa]